MNHLRSSLSRVALLSCLAALAIGRAAGTQTMAFNYKSRSSQLDLLQRRSGTAGYVAGRIDTLRLLALRVEFVADTIAETTGDGKFMLQPPSEPTIDPPPHDRRYFDAQLQALANYYRTVSNGKLILTWDLYPQAETTAYQLPNPMIYYAPGDDHPEKDRRLVELFRDAVQAADLQDGPSFSEFDAFIVFHAGVGNDVSFDFDPTPNDVPSAFLSLADLREHLANNDPTFPGIAVNNGNFFVREGIILPETENQEGFEIGLLGTAAIMMGFQLGLPALFNAENGASGIGRWGLMDQGSGNFQGLLPAEPSAWEKVFMGWEQPVEIRFGENFQVAAPRVTITPNKIYKIPISGTEYFLVENRQRDVNGDNLAVGFDISGNRVEFSDANGGEIAAGTAIGVIVSVDEYDYGLPGSGILIWHIDEAVIREKLAENRVNADRDHRGVDLEEADGAQDIGRFYGFLDPGAGAENGVPEDAWWASNEVITRFLRPGQPVRFGPDTQPSSRANNRANSHIVIDGFSERQPIMTFSVRNTMLVDGFPQFCGPGALPPVAVELDRTIPGKEVVVARQDGVILAWRANGSSYFPATEMVSAGAPGKELRQYLFARFAVLPESLKFPPAVADLNADGNEELVFVDLAGNVTVLTGRDADDDLAADVLWQNPVDVAPSTEVVVRQSDRTIWAGFSNGEMYGFAANGTRFDPVALLKPISHLALVGDLALIAAGEEVYVHRRGRPVQLLHRFTAPVSGLAITDIDNDERLDFVALAVDARGVIYDETGALRYELALQTDPAPAGLAVGDVDGDGFKDLVLASPGGLFAFSRNGASLLDFPIRHHGVRFAGSPARPPEPLLLDIAGDGTQAVFAIGGDGDLHAYDSRGRTLDGFPVAVADPTLTIGGAFDIDDDGYLELLVLSGDAFVTAFRLPGLATEGAHAWPVWGQNPSRSRSNLRRETPQTPGIALLPANAAYNYPNPAIGPSTTIRYRLNAPARVFIRIFDLAGDLVDEFPGPAVPGADNEVLWSLGAVQSGVYMARIEAKGERETAVAIFKIAVVR